MDNIKRYIKAFFYAVAFWVFSLIPLFIFLIVSEYTQEVPNYSYNKFAQQIIPSCLPIVFMKLFRWDGEKNFWMPFFKWTSILIGIACVIYLIMMELAFTKEGLDKILTIPMYILSFIYVFNDFKYEFLKSEEEAKEDIKLLEDEAYK